MELDQVIITETLVSAVHHSRQQDWLVVQQLCRQVLEAIAKDPRYYGKIQYNNELGAHHVNLSHAARYCVWGFHFRWASHAVEYAAFLQELGYEWDQDISDRNKGEEALALALLDEEKNDEIALAKAEALEREC